MAPYNAKLIAHISDIVRRAKKWKKGKKGGKKCMKYFPPIFCQLSKGAQISVIVIVWIGIGLFVASVYAAIECGLRRSDGAEFQHNRKVRIKFFHCGLGWRFGIIVIFWPAVFLLATHNTSKEGQKMTHATERSVEEENAKLSGRLSDLDIATQKSRLAEGKSAIDNLEQRYLMRTVARIGTRLRAPSAGPYLHR